MEITLADATAYCEAAARPLGVSGAVHVNDYMLHFALAKAEGDEMIAGAARNYIEGGAADAKTLADILYKTLKRAPNKPLRLLEFAAGYGRVTRHLSSALPNASVVAVDVHEAAVKFAQDKLGVTSVLSTKMPEAFYLPQKFDVVFALSFFTHMPPATFGRWIAALYQQLEPGGFLIFTTAGKKPYALDGRVEGDFEGKSAIFLPSSEQKDLDTADYGGMFVLPSYVIREIYEHARAPIALYEENFWWGFQDLWVLTKT